MTLYYRDITNKYVGAFDGNTGKVPPGSIQVPFPPGDARSIWNGSTWNDPVLTVPEKEENLGVTLESTVEALLQAVGYGDTTLLDDLKIKIAQAKI